MDGSLPPSISQLKCLRMIELATMVDLRGPLPVELCSIKTLRRLCICRCGLSGPLPPEIGGLISLEELQLFGNNLTGKIPDTLGNLVSLKLLSLGEYTGGNNFDPSPLPLCLSGLRSLEALFLANCQLTGRIPAWIGQLKGKTCRNPSDSRIPSSYALSNIHICLYLCRASAAGSSTQPPEWPAARSRRSTRQSLVLEPQRQRRTQWPPAHCGAVELEKT
jgi:hypothetical protein